MSGKTVVIKAKYGLVVLLDGEKGKDHEVEWVSPGVKAYLQGSFSRGDYLVACNLLNQWCIENHIPLHSVRRVKPRRATRAKDTETKRMF